MNIALEFTDHIEQRTEVLRHMGYAEQADGINKLLRSIREDLMQPEVNVVDLNDVLDGSYDLVGALTKRMEA